MGLFKILQQKKKSIYYHKRGEKRFATCFKESKERFSKGFMAIVGFHTKSRKKAKKKLKKNIKINSKDYQEHVST